MLSMSKNISTNNKVGKLLRFLFAVAILFIACAVSFFWITHKPRAARQKPESKAPLVETMKASVADQLVTVRAMGTVAPSQSVNLTSRVNGEIVCTNSNFLPGGKFKIGEEILQIDSTDYKLMVKQKQSDVARAEHALKLEIGQQSIAVKEYKLFEETLYKQDRDLVLRKSYLDAAKANLKAAEASLERANLDLKRTRIVSPFNAVVQSKHVGVGSQVLTGTPLITLVDTDNYWVEVSIPMDKLKWISIPDANNDGSTVRITHETSWGKDAFRIGTVTRLMTELEPKGRMARLLVTVKDPLCLQSVNKGKPQLILGAFMRAFIEGKKLPNVVYVPRFALHDGDQVWIITTNQTLDIRKIDIVWSESNFVYAENFVTDGEMLIVSALAAPVHGMQLRIASLNNETPINKVRGAAKRKRQ